MGFLDDFTNNLQKQLDERMKKVRKELAQRSDAEIKRMYNNPNLNDTQRQLVEEEAYRRGII